MTDKTTDQVKKAPNPTGKGGFADNPQNRNDGTWSPRNTFSFQMNRFKNMTITELTDWNKNTSNDVRTVAEDLAFKRVFNAQKELAEFKEVADRTEGKAKQTIEHEGGIETTSNDQIAVMIQAALLKDDQSEENTDNQDTDN